jgi:hypothetical protein
MSHIEQNVAAMEKLTLPPVMETTNSLRHKCFVESRDIEVA